MILGYQFLFVIAIISLISIPLRCVVGKDMEKSKMSAIQLLLRAFHPMDLERYYLLGMILFPYS